MPAHTLTSQRFPVGPKMQRHTLTLVKELSRTLTGGRQHKYKKLTF